MIQIKKVIELFEKALPVYEKALKMNTVSMEQLANMNIDFGICDLLLNQSPKTGLVNLIFKKTGHYKHYLNFKDTFLFKYPSFIRFNEDVRYETKTTKYNECLRFRRDLLKTEIKELNKLIKQGYTHI